MRCEAVLKSEVAFVTEEDSAQRAAMMMRDENVGFLPVCDDAGVVIGAITDRDLAVRLCAEGAASGDVPVGDVMTREVVSCQPDDDLTRAEHLMARYRKQRVIVCDEAGRLVGVVSLADVVSRDSNRHAAHTLRKIVAREYRF